MNFVKGNTIHNHPELKQSFFALAKSTFQLDFEQWDTLGYNVWKNYEIYVKQVAECVDTKR